MTICKHWKELDGENGFEYEYCRLEHKKCSCCGMKEQCSFKWLLTKENIPEFLREETT